MRKRPEPKVCQAPRCKRPVATNPRRWVEYETPQGNPRRVRTCRGCHDRYKRNGTFERIESSWVEKDAYIVGLRKKGLSVDQIIRLVPGLPRRTAYEIFHRNRLGGVWGYEVGQGGGRRRA